MVKLEGGGGSGGEWSSRGGRLKKVEVEGQRGSKILTPFYILGMGVGSLGFWLWTGPGFVFGWIWNWIFGFILDPYGFIR